MKIRTLVFGTSVAVLALVPLAASEEACTAQQADLILHDVAPLESCATNALADALLLGSTDPFAIIAQCAGLTLQVLANIARDLLASPASPPVVADSGVGFDPRPQMAQAAREVHLKAVLLNIGKQGVYPQTK